jgi:hypothetical protein
VDELTSEQEEAVAATVGAIQRIAMAIVALPKEERAAHYAIVRRNFEAAHRAKSHARTFIAAEHPSQLRWG